MKLVTGFRLIQFWLHESTVFCGSQISMSWLRCQLQHCKTFSQETKISRTIWGIRGEKVHWHDGTVIYFRLLKTNFPIASIPLNVVKIKSIRWESGKAKGWKQNNFHSIKRNLSAAAWQILAFSNYFYLRGFFAIFKILQGSIRLLKLLQPLSYLRELF